MAVIRFLLTCFIFFVSTNEAARILAVFPTPSISHQVVFRPLTLELAKRGHDVTVITTDPIFTNGKPPANFTEIDVHDVSYSVWKKSFLNRENTNDDVISQMKIFSAMFIDIFDGQLRNEHVSKLLRDKNQKFDLLILEACVRPALIFSHIYDNVPVIQMSSFGAVYDNFINVGAPIHPLLYPSVPRKRLNNLSLWEKIDELYTYIRINMIYADYLPIDEALLKRHFGPDIPSLTELSKRIDMLFLNVHPIFEGIRPMPPNVIYTGGLHQTPTKELPTDLKSYLDSSKHGVIYISFGTNVDPTLLSPERIQILVKTVSKLPYDVLWKWNGDELPGRTANIRISKWLPQSDLLKHPKIKVFVTQAGLQSTDESIAAGVPLIAMPMIGDQPFNAERYEQFKIGIHLKFETVSEEKFKNAILKVINDDSYRKNIAKLREVLRDEVQTPLERAVWWTEYVLRHGGAKHLRSPAANISWAEYLELELVLTLFSVLLAIFIVSAIVIRKLYKIVTSHVNIKAKKE
ncbi:UDP-glucuronosyltransferase 2B20-like [Trichoplusia ni]|uniref:UDP-glucuronosyltransferase n=1 Tax=Trichoplusia ni TaxID=7111 RepID=A0A7E5W5W2_TRINI|nr:UDP-glucuronosyltransferase 2B20-like [Trichoplusia ni]